MSLENVLAQVDASIHLKVAQSSSYHMAPFGAHFMAAVLLCLDLHENIQTQNYIYSSYVLLL